MGEGNVTHRDLDVYKQSMVLVGNIYKLTQTFPKSEVFGLASQMQRAAVSIPSNIAEGASRNGTKEYIHFLSVSTGSASELETQLGVAKILGYCIDNDEYNRLILEVNKIRYMLVQLKKSLSSKL
ncbi:MAG: four helix bundle protein [Candidatus Cloacimonetes bacterium HGW-Cloacimonetes-3]|nr:MAG: four helix bundle protein [Candidatus Cloacimonetes bacterium HGW-Cloacimonetes-3]